MCRARQAYGLFLIATVALLLWAPMIGLRQDALSHRENRALAQRPEWNGEWGALPEFVERWEAYFNDQYGFRREAIQFSEGIWARLGLGAPPAVIRGRDGWLFLGKMGRESPLRDYAGTNLLSEEELENWTASLERRWAYARSQGKRYVFLIAPNKMELYGEYLPAKYLRRRGASRCEQLVAYVRAHSEVPILYAKESMAPLLEADDDMRGYAKGGTHWNAYGAALGQNALAEWLEHSVSELQGVYYSREDFRWAEAGVDVDLARMLGIEALYPERAPVLKRQEPEFDRGTLGAGGSGDRVVFENGRSLRFLAFGDSFFGNLLPYLGNYFGSGALIEEMPTWDGFQAAVDAHPAEVIIEQRVERMLWRLPDGDAGE